MKFIRLSLSLVLCFMMLAGTAFAAEVEEEPLYLDWIEGGTTVPVGEFSSLQLDESLLYLGEEDTALIQSYFGNNVYGTELGSVFSASETEDWYVLFEYEEVGYISDRDKGKINAKELLKSYQKGTEESNEGRPEEDQLFVKGWYTEPYYDEEDSTLIWALLAQDFYGNELINYNVRILTREGYVSVLLVTDPQTLDHDVQILNSLILPNYSIHEGTRYEDHDPATDKVSELGLTGLILGGAGLVAAKKAGLLLTVGLLLKKFWFIVIAIPVAIWNWIRRRKSSANQETAETLPVDSTNSDNSVDSNQR